MSNTFTLFNLWCDVLPVVWHNIIPWWRSVSCDTWHVTCVTVDNEVRRDAGDPVTSRDTRLMNHLYKAETLRISFLSSNQLRLDRVYWPNKPSLFSSWEWESNVTNTKTDIYISWIKYSASWQKYLATICVELNICNFLGLLFYFENLQQTWRSHVSCCWSHSHVTVTITCQLTKIYLMKSVSRVEHY